MGQGIVTSASLLCFFNQIKKRKMKLGAFSVSLHVKDIHISKIFYEHLGFVVFSDEL